MRSSLICIARSTESDMNLFLSLEIIFVAKTGGQTSLMSGHFDEFCST